MSYKYRVTLKGLKGFFRVYLTAAGNSLYSFHKRLRADLEFPQDQQILFKAFDEAGNVAGRFALTALPGNKAVDEVSLAETVKAGIVSFEYFYDVVSRKCPTQWLLPSVSRAKVPFPLNSKTAMWPSKTFRKTSASCPARTMTKTSTMKKRISRKNRTTSPRKSLTSRSSSGFISERQ